MTFLLAYTYSKALDDASSFDGFMNFSNYGLSRGLSSFDVTHNVVASYNWAIPFERALSTLPERSDIFVSFPKRHLYLLPVFNLITKIDE